jgi:DNA-directed RNA polymerase specialized sigma24 family protein
MSKDVSSARPSATRPKGLWSALLGAITALAAAAPAEEARADITQPSHEHCRAVAPEQPVEPTPTATLRSLIERRAEAAERAGRYDDVDQLTTLWLTLERREQLDRVVARGDQFINVSLRNQRRSEQRSDTRALRRGAVDAEEIELPAFTLDPVQALEAERFVAALDEPYRSAVQWSLTGMNHREVAEKMGASHAAVRKWAQRLRDRLAEDGWSAA